MGRSAELEQLVVAASSPPSLAMLSGGAGMGKSRLVAELIARLPGLRVLVGRFHRLRDPFPLGPIAEVLRDLGPDLAGRELSPVAGVLRTLVPELADRLPQAPDEPTDRRMLRHSQFRAVVEVLRTLGRAVLVVEDAHWTDSLTLEFLAYLVGDPPPQLSVVVTYRAEEVAPSVPALAARPTERLTVDRIMLEPWDTEATAAMAAGFLRIAEVSEEFAAHLCRRAAGIPLATQELLRLLVERGSVARHEGEWWRRTIDELDVPAGVRDPVLERVALLDAASRRLVEAAAVLQLPVPVATLTEVAALPHWEGRIALAAAQRSGLVVERDGRLEPVHVLAGQAVYDSLVPVQRRELHRRSATALRRTAVPPLGQIAHHLHAADEVAQWIDTAEEAAAQAWSAGDDEEAVSLLVPALRAAPPDPVQRWRLAMALVRSALYFPRGREIADLLVELPMQDFTQVDAADLSLSVAKLVRNVGGDPARISELASRAAETAQLSLDRRVDALGLLSEQCATGGARDDLLRTLDRLADAALEGSVEPPVATAAQLASLWLRFGDARWREVLPKALVDRAPVTLPEVVATYRVAEAAGTSGHYELSHRLARACLAPNDKRVRRPLLVAAVQTLGFELDYWCGEWDGLEAAIRQHLTQALAAGISHKRGQAMLGALILSRLGPTGDVVDLLDRALLDAATTGSLPVIANAVGPRARVAQARGRARDESFSGLEAWFGAVTAGMVAPCMYRPLAAVTRMWSANGCGDRAEELVGVMSRSARQLEAPLAAGALWHARGHLAAAAGRWDEAGDHYLAAADLHDTALTPYDAAQAREEAAGALAATDRPAAADVLHTAIAAYQRLGAAWDLDRVFGLARAHGLPVPPRHRSGPRGYGDELSPRERTVAELAAAGHTNREIAADLYVSVHTVNKQMNAVLRKLGLSSRRQLRQHLVEGVPAAAGAVPPAGN